MHAAGDVAQMTTAAFKSTLGFGKRNLPFALSLGGIFCLIVSMLNADIPWMTTDRVCSNNACKSFRADTFLNIGLVKMKICDTSDDVTVCAQYASADVKDLNEVTDSCTGDAQTGFIMLCLSLGFLSVGIFFLLAHKMTTGPKKRLRGRLSAGLIFLSNVFPVVALIIVHKSCVSLIKSASVGGGFVMACLGQICLFSALIAQLVYLRSVQEMPSATRTAASVAGRANDLSIVDISKQTISTAISAWRTHAPAFLTILALVFTAISMSGHQVSWTHVACTDSGSSALKDVHYTNGMLVDKQCYTTSFKSYGEAEVCLVGPYSDLQKFTFKTCYDDVKDKSFETCDKVGKGAFSMALFACLTLFVSMLFIFGSHSNPARGRRSIFCLLASIVFLVIGPVIYIESCIKLDGMNEGKLDTTVNGGFFLGVMALAFTFLALILQAMYLASPRDAVSSSSSSTIKRSEAAADDEDPFRRKPSEILDSGKDPARKVSITDVTFGEPGQSSNDYTSPRGVAADDDNPFADTDVSPFAEIQPQRQNSSATATTKPAASSDSAYGAQDDDDHNPFANT